MYANRTTLTGQELLLRLDELEEIVGSPEEPGNLEKAERLAIYIASSASNRRIADLAMQATSAIIDLRNARASYAGGEKLARLLGQLRSEMRAGALLSPAAVGLSENPAEAAIPHRPTRL